MRSLGGLAAWRDICVYCASVATRSQLAGRQSAGREAGADEDGKPQYRGGARELDPAFRRAPKGLEALAEQECRRLTGR